MDDDDENDEFEEFTQDPQQTQIQKLIAEVAEKNKQAMHYMVLEGFIEPTDDPGVFKYTPEGFVLMQQEYKKLKDLGLL